MYFKVFLLACLVTNIYSANSNVNIQDIDERIIGGEDALPGQFPYLVSIQQPGEGLPYDHTCGGAILNERWILTAAHCLEDDEIPLVVKAGKYDLSRKETGEQVVAVKKFFKHKLYEENGISHDIALMKLRTPLKLNENVAKVALPEKDSEATGQMGTLAGWGYWNLDLERPIIPILQSITMPIIGRKSCNKFIKKLNTAGSISETDICTFGSPAGGIGPCDGDSGSLLVVTNDRGKVEFVGIDSWSFIPCTVKGAPEVYTSVSKFIDWIENIINTNKC